MINTDETQVLVNRREAAMYRDNAMGCDAQRYPLEQESLAWIDDEYCLECDETDVRELVADNLGTLPPSD
jgi:hypothetical protein